ncbi:TetR/AcrR family transcriptional regulator [Allobranchiibius sp. GilTou38]|uniref:TetR/AcrR family transcriptional regulator n=1 Tax=Allobranchiibius sp. GilTou38 TaxID=2815210 RepID=UPI001AA1D4B4|nr:TetR/AcrR family transcriptional regulator [Allobranchiibius sp. GilTou38]MBO1767892.1 TetR/AcrR family transcriptional regulator [Allobranchiibius sp. GilTou38]
MTSTRSSATDEESLLDAARDCVLAVGWRRTTVTDVARRAGVSRMTFYRRWPDMTALTADLMTREFAGAGSSVRGRSADDEVDAASIAARVSSAVTEIRKDPLFQKIIDVDPELLLPYLLDRRGRAQDIMLAALVDRIREGQRSGGVRSGRPEVLARTVLLICHGFVISAQTMQDSRYSDRIARRELTQAVESYLA